MRTYEILDEDGETVGLVDAECERDALAMHAVEEGYSDPRLEGDEYFFLTSEGKVGMIFCNSELEAIEFKLNAEK